MNRLLDIERALKPVARIPPPPSPRPPPGTSARAQMPARARPVAQALQVDYRVPGVFAVVRQPSKYTCWATVATMMIDWRRQQNLPINDAMAAIGGAWAAKFAADAPMSAYDKVAFLRDAKLSSETPQGYTAEGWRALLQRYGPLWITTDEAPSGHFAIHARMVVGIRGDGTPAGTKLDIIDPGTGARYRETLDDLAHGFDKAAFELKVSPGIQVVHWPTNEFGVAQGAEPLAGARWGQYAIGADAAPPAATLSDCEVIDVEIRDPTGKVSDFSHEYPVDLKGEIKMPVLPRIPARGRTLVQVADDIRKELLDGVFVGSATVNARRTGRKVNYVTPIAKGEVLAVRILMGSGSADKASGTYQVDSNGQIDLPYLGKVDALGKKIPQFEDEIEAGIRDGFIPRAVVHVSRVDKSGGGALR